MAYEILKQKSERFAHRIVKMYKLLKKRHQTYCMGDQVLRSGTSIGANINEAIFSQSVSDNISKFSIALKEAYESLYWLDLLLTAEYITLEQEQSMNKDCLELVKMLISAINTLKKKSNTKK